MGHKVGVFLTLFKRMRGMFSKKGQTDDEREKVLEGKR